MKLKTQVAALLLTSWTMSPPDAVAYTGGPIRARLVGLEPNEVRIYFELQAFDEGGYPPEVYCLDLRSPTPSKPIRMAALEPQRTDRGDIRSPQWLTTFGRLLPLGASSDFELSMSVATDSLGLDAEWNVRRFDLSVTVQVGDASGHCRVEAFCMPLVRVRALYEVPGRSERVALVSYVGRPYGCEEVDVPLVVR